MTKLKKNKMCFWNTVNTVNTSLLHVPYIGTYISLNQIDIPLHPHRT